jgi:hypothetical protein
MSKRILIMGASKSQDTDPKLMPALLRFQSQRWYVVQNALPQVKMMQRFLVIHPHYGIISGAQPIAYVPDADKWGNTAKGWKKDIPRVHLQYNRLVKHLIDPGTDVFVSANATQKAMLIECGLQQDVVERGASLTMPTANTLEGVETLRKWLLAPLDQVFSPLMSKEIEDGLNE